MANLISRISLFALFLVAIIAYVASTGQAAKGPIITNKVRVPAKPSVDGDQAEPNPSHSHLSGLL
jgi:hypothetical protein